MCYYDDQYRIALLFHAWLMYSTKNEIDTVAPLSRLYSTPVVWSAPVWSGALHSLTDRSVMLSRAAFRAGRRYVQGGRLAFSARLMSADTTPALAPEAYKATSPDAFERFDPSKYLAEETAPSVKAELQRIRAAEDEAIANVTAEIPEVDWESWRKDIGYAGLVDELKAAHDAVPVPDVESERQRLQKAVFDAFNPLLAKLKEQALEAEANSKVYADRLEEIKHLHDNVADMPIDEFLAKYPAVRKSIEDDIQENRWFV